MSSGQWEIVGKNKKDKINNQTSKKPVKNDSKSKKPVPAPKVEDILPMSQVNTIYSNIGKSNKENKKPQEKEIKPKELAKKNAAKKSSPEIPKSKPPKSIESALNLINADDLKECLENSKQHFPDAPLVWLKELAAYFNTKINLEINDSVFSNKSDGYPLNTMPSPLKQVMDKAIQEAGGKQIAQVFFDNSVTAMANDMSKGLPSIGHKLWIQHLALYCPQITAAHFEKHSLLRTSYQNRQHIGLSILWALGQGGLKDFHIGLKVFKEFMLPLLEMKNYSRFIVKYLSQHLNRHSQIVLSKENYFYIFDLIHTKHSVSNEINLELNGLNKKLNSILFAKTGDKKFPTFFEPLLLKLTNTQLNSKAFFAEVSDVLITCLKRDSACYTTWKNLYSKNYEQSWILLKYIGDNWNKINNQIDKKHFKDLLQYFVAVNSELIVKHKKNYTLIELEKLSKTLISKMTVKKSLFPWKFIPLVLSIAIASLIFYDINHHGSWKKAQSVRTLKSIGVWEYGEKAWEGANQGFNWTKQRIEEYAPGYVDASIEFVEPYIDLVKDLSIIGYNVFMKMWQAVMDKVPVVFETIEKVAPGLLDEIKNTWISILNALGNYWEKAVKYITTEVFIDDFSPENMQKMILNAVDVTQKYAVESYNWAYEKIQTVIAGN